MNNNHQDNDIMFVMRLDRMHKIHPTMDTSHSCTRCGETVGIYPSGQKTLKAYGSTIDLVCNMCKTPDENFGRPAGNRGDVQREQGESIQRDIQLNRR